MQHPVQTSLSNCVSLNMYMYLTREEYLCIHSFPSPSLFWYNNKKACQGLPPVTTSRYSIYICAVCAAPSIHLHVCNVCKWLLLNQSIILLFCYTNIKIKTQIVIQFDNAMHNQAGSLERRPTQLPECALKHSFLLVEMFKLHRNQECHYSTDSTSTRIALDQNFQLS